MGRRLFQILTVALIALIGLGGGVIRPGFAATGDSVAEADGIPNEGFVRSAALGPGQSYWFRIDYLADTDLAITLHLRAEDREVRDAVNARVNVGDREERRPSGEANVDAPGFVRIGTLTTTSDGGPDRKFWLNTSGIADTYFLRLQNASNRRVPFVLTVDRTRVIAGYIAPRPDAPPLGQPELPTPAPAVSPAAEPLLAFAELVDQDGNPIGAATLTQDGTGPVQVQVVAAGLTPGDHGIHIHAIASCEPLAFTSAGGHFNPLHQQHGLENPAGPHAGDLPGLVADEDGTALYETETALVTLGAGPTSLFDADGSALVIHALPDDQVTDPTGNSGDRVACGVIERVR